MFSAHPNGFAPSVPYAASRPTGEPRLRAVMRMVVVAAGMILFYSASAHANCAPPTGGGIAVCSPAPGSSDVNPVHYIAAASSPSCAAGMALMSISTSSGAQL